MKYVEEAFSDNWVVPLGPNVDGFEHDLERFLASGPSPTRLDSPEPGFTPTKEKRAVALSAGTAAIHLGLIGCGVEPGDEVMVQSFTFSASANPVRYLGATPVFVDSEPETWNMDPVLLDRAIADRAAKTGRKPKAIVPVCLYGMPAKTDEILAVAKKWEIPVVEDAAEALGSRYRGRCCGSFGRYGALSFNGNKMITTSGGGALVCEDDEAARRIKFLATQARESYPYYQHEEIGYNYRMSNICAGIGRGQMEVLDIHIAHHRHVQQLYREMLGGIKGITLHDNPSPVFDSNFWLCAATLDEGTHIAGENDAYKNCNASTAVSAHTDSKPDAAVEALRIALDSANIEARPLWKPMHLQPVYRNNIFITADGVNRGRSNAYIDEGKIVDTGADLFHRGLCLPSDNKMTTEQQDIIINIIHRCFM